MKQAWVMAAATALLAGCGSAPETANNTVAPATTAGGTDHVAAIRALPEAQRRATFLRAIRDASQGCQQVVDDREAEPVNGNAAWGVRCEDGRGWLISIAPDGNAKVTGPVARQ